MKYVSFRVYLILSIKHVFYFYFPVIHILSLYSWYWNLYETVQTWIQNIFREVDLYDIF